MKSKGPVAGLGPSLPGDRSCYTIQRGTVTNVAEDCSAVSDLGHTGSKYSGAIGGFPVDTPIEPCDT
jgi:hypothetical protein